MSKSKKLLVTGMIALVGIAIGFAAGVWLALPKNPGESSAEAGFARDMSTHHAQAIEMAMLEYRNGEDVHLRSIAYDIATAQAAQIGMMDAWLREWKLPLTTTTPRMAWMPGGEEWLLPDGRMPGMASDEQLAHMKNLSGRELDILFCQLMTAHHIGGVHMVDGVLDQTDNDQVRTLAQSMKTGQQYEIDILTRKLQEFGVDPSTVPEVPEP